MKPYQHGFVVGKFLPLHNGHVFLIDEAVAACERLTILLLSQPDESIAGSVRLSWLQLLYPGCTIIHHDIPLPRDSSGYGHWDTWLESILRLCTDDYDAVFSSEAYGATLAADLSADHVLVDQARDQVPISGTTIRQDPSLHFQYLPAIVQTYYENQN